MARGGALVAPPPMLPVAALNAARVAPPMLAAVLAAVLAAAVEGPAALLMPVLAADAAPVAAPLPRQTCSTRRESSDGTPRSA